MQPATINTFALLWFGLLILTQVTGMMLFCVGLVRAKNTNTIMLKHLCAISIAGIVFLYGGHHIIYHMYLHTKGTEALAMLFYQTLLPVVMLSIVIQITAERLKLWPFVVMTIFLVGGIYPVTAYWTWGQGFLHKMGFIDSGAGTVYLTGAVAGFMGNLLMGVRQDKYNRTGSLLPIKGANIPLAALGMLLAWAGTFGFNSGIHSVGQPISNIHTVVLSFTNTFSAVAASMFVALVVARVFIGFADITFILNAAFAGMVAIAASPISATENTAMLLGAVVGLLIIPTIRLVDRMRVDDPMGAISVFGMSSIVGLLASVVTQDYASLSTQHKQAWMWFDQLCVQCYGIGSIIIWVGLSSLAVWLTIRFIMGLRIKSDAEQRGLDVVDCGIAAYPEFTVNLD